MQLWLPQGKDKEAIPLPLKKNWPATWFRFVNNGVLQTQKEAVQAPCKKKKLKRGMLQLVSFLPPPWWENSAMVMNIGFQGSLSWQLILLLSWVSLSALLHLSVSQFPHQ